MFLALIIPAVLGIHRAVHEGRIAQDGRAAEHARLEALWRLSLAKAAREDPSQDHNLRSAAVTPEGVILETSRGECTDTPGWTDVLGHDCAVYETVSNGPGTAGKQACVNDDRAMPVDFFLLFADMNNGCALDHCCMCGKHKKEETGVSSCPGIPSLDHVLQMAVAGGIPGCKDTPDWTDRDGFGCTEYIPRQCYQGKNMVPESALAAFAGEHGPASRHCCGCGGGSTWGAAAGTAVNDMLGLDQCYDLPGFRDKELKRCFSYTDSCGDGKPHFVEDFYIGKSRNGISALDACCACGGSRDKVGRSVCKDSTGWTDKDGDGCDQYGGSCANGAPTEEREIYEMFAVDHISALDACCICGGGEASGPFSGISPCTDSKNDWQDKNGKSCEAYQQHSWCLSGRVLDRTMVDVFAYGMEKEDTAEEVCCVCGGGSGYATGLQAVSTFITMWELEICPPNLALLSSDAVDQVKMDIHECVAQSTEIGADGVAVKSMFASDGTQAGSSAHLTADGPDGIPDAPSGPSAPRLHDFLEVSGRAAPRPGMSLAEALAVVAEDGEEVCTVARFQLRGFFQEDKFKPELAACLAAYGYHMQYVRQLHDQAVSGGKLICQSFMGWKDAQGDGCDAYADRCTAGEPLHGHPQRGTVNKVQGNVRAIKDLHVNGTSAVQACCMCGGGDMKTEWDDSWPNLTNILPFNEPNKSEILAAANKSYNDHMNECQDLVGWQDKFGGGCSFYESMCADGAPFDPPEKYTKFATIEGDLKGLSSLDACCICGGGKSRFEEAATTTTPAPFSAEGCHNFVGWVDTENEDCEYYVGQADMCAGGAMRPARTEQEFTRFAVDGFSALDACCACGGGATRDNNNWCEGGPPCGGGDNLVPGAKILCHDFMGWTDTGGDGCDFYDNMCENNKPSKPEEAYTKYAAAEGPMAGVSALDACCSCGGGTRVSEISQHHPGAVCTDHLHFTDNDGFGCTDYAGDWCSGYYHSPHVHESKAGVVAADGDYYYMNQLQGHGSLLEFDEPANSTAGEEQVLPRTGQLGPDAPLGGHGEHGQHTHSARKVNKHGHVGGAGKAHITTDAIHFQERAIDPRHSAIESCCACGGGTWALPPSHPHAYSGPCTDYDHWADDRGHTCPQYTQIGFGTQDVNDVDGHAQAFCANGAANLGIHEFHLMMNAPDDETSIITALNACCACGGGIQDIKPPPEGPGTELRSHPATNGGIEGCEDSPQGWQDSAGSHCHEYTDWCHAGAPLVASKEFLTRKKDNHTALNVCCVCGGGDRTADHAAQRLADLQARMARCSNIEGFLDVDARGCDHYSTVCVGPPMAWDKTHILMKGTADGLTALDACCVCGGGYESDGLGLPDGANVNMMTNGSGTFLIGPDGNAFPVPPGYLGDLGPGQLVVNASGQFFLGADGQAHRIGEHDPGLIGRRKNQVCRSYMWVDNDNRICREYKKKGWCKQNRVHDRHAVEGHRMEYSAADACCECGGGEWIVDKSSITEINPKTLMTIKVIRETTVHIDAPEDEEVLEHGGTLAGESSSSLDNVGMGTQDKQAPPQDARTRAENAAAAANGLAPPGA